MHRVTRREFVLSAATTAAVFGLGGRMAISAPAKQKSRDPKPGIHRYKVGDAECIAIYDGIWEKAHDPAFFQNATIEDTKKALAKAKQRTDFVPIPIMALLIKHKGKLILCDTGGGDQVQAFNPNSVFVSGKMRTNLKAAGIDPKKIETILISHFHPDHIFGLLKPKTNEPVYPNAEIILSAAEYKWWTDTGLAERVPPGRKRLVQRIQSCIPKWKNVLPVEGEDEVVPGIRFVKAPGHTPGHTAFHLSSGKDQLLISGDMLYVPAFLAAHPDWHGAYDQSADLAEATRRKLLDRVIADKMMICGSHFPWPGLGKISKDGKGYAFKL
ncbi:MAG TPA: MBL fold metallo-hydrolase [Hyphomicrobiales bacterium]|jgi:glyoxylase-like metal-dependent hydrolase (beta-lactamase superfamily II)